MKNKIFYSFVCLTLFLALPFAVFAQRNPRKPAPSTEIKTPAPQTLDEKIKEALADFRGNAWIYAKNLDSGRVYEFRADERVRTASTIKLPIMTEVFAQVAAGRKVSGERRRLTADFYNNKLPVRLRRKKSEKGEKRGVRSEK